MSPLFIKVIETCIKTAVLYIYILQRQWTPVIADRVWQTYCFTRMCLMCFCLCPPTALYSIHKKKVYGAKMLESQNLQTPKSKYVMTHEKTCSPKKKKIWHCFCNLAKQFSIDPALFWSKNYMPDEFFLCDSTGEIAPPHCSLTSHFAFAVVPPYWCGSTKTTTRAWATSPETIWASSLATTRTW